MMQHHDPLQVQPCHWRIRFDALVAARLRTPFAWGQHDCCLWAADSVLCTTGTDPAADVRGHYNNATQAARLLADLGGLGAVGARAGTPVLPLAACVGDVGVVAMEGRATLAVCCGALWLAPAAAGLAALPLSAGVMAWRVAHA